MMKCDCCPLAPYDDTCPECEGEYGIEHKRTFDGHCNAEFCCDNENSEYYAVPTFYNDTCEEWEKE